MKTYVTFGQRHYHEIKGKVFDKDCVAVIKARTIDEGRDKAFELFDRQFFTTYTDESVGNMEAFMQFFPRGLIDVE